MDGEKDNKITEEQSDCFVVDRDEVTAAKQTQENESAVNSGEKTGLSVQNEDSADNIAEEDEPKYPRKNKRSNLWGNIFCIVSIVATFVAMYFVSAGISDEPPLSEAIKEVNVQYLLIAIGTLLLMMLLDSLKYVVIMWANGIKPHYPTALKVSLLGKYYDNITPFSSGGQPMQIYYLHKKGLGGGKSSGVIMAKMAFNMTLWLTICCLLMTLNRGALDTYVTNDAQRQTFTIMGWVGFGVNCFLPITILLFALFPKMIEAITRWILFLGHKLKIVKDKDATFNRAKKGVAEFKNSFVSMLKKPLQSCILIVLCAVEPFLGMMLPYFAVVALGGASVVPSTELMFAIMTLNVYVSMSATIIPTPGNMGAIETAFMMTLTTIAEGTLFWTVFGWRLLSFYSYIIIGLVMTIVQIARQNRYKKTLLN
ncbi:MAG: flippase-like domain-containing protein [Corallococcus sp.]|nr:flippase-like domain-containing protein [Corallococcus sp.]MCM1359032.1 flippase-like domain-containing protein [Corallococcus sp.]MCM1395021.1 flippase-like domain-containing protein [Corallococcus sp.]